MKCILDTLPKKEREQLIQTMLDSAIAESGTDQYKYVLGLYRRIKPFMHEEKEEKDNAHTTNPTL